MILSTRKSRGSLVLVLSGALALLSPAAAMAAEQVSREQDIVDLRLGQRIQVDDGSCPAGQIKEIAGTNLTAAGVVRSRKCVPRLGIKKK